MSYFDGKRQSNQTERKYHPVGSKLLISRVTGQVRSYYGSFLIAHWNVQMRCTIVPNMQAGSGTRDSYMIYKIKRLAKILAVCAGIVVVSVSLGIISALELLSHHK